MAKPLPLSGVGVVRIILKNKDAFQCNLRSKETQGERTSYLFDVFYENAAGTLNIAVEKDEIVLAALNLSLGKVTNLNNDANLKKLCKYVLEKAA
ncbi:hypothetical protein [Dubosiella muris]|uniref:Uncharacterized protein n=1 Tax=Dubosiella muris TaxID=3038133 RepID=A0AC61R612_9FIRM|nr:hypothetical protein [Dubosiella muris]TGY65507.1 hypothetical protein E5336_08065 [Dubosiella muris]